MEKPINGIFISIGVGAWFLFLIIFQFKKRIMILEEKGGKQRLVGRNDFGNGNTENFKLYIIDVYTLEDASEYLQKKVELAELETAKAEAKAYEHYREKGKEFPLGTPLLSLDEVEDLRHFASMELESSEKFDELAIQEFIQDKTLELFYKKDTDKEPLEVNPVTKKKEPTKHYKKWIETTAKPLSLFVNTQLQTQLKLIETKKITELSERKRDLIARSIAKEFSVNQIRGAISGDVEGGAIIGWLKRFDDYKEILSQDHLLEKALEYAEASFHPPIFQVPKNTELRKMVRNVVLVEEHTWDHEPDFPFRLIVIYANRPLDTAVQWGAVKTTFQGYSNIPMREGYANLNTFSKATFDIYMAALAHAPGKGYIRPTMVLTEEEIVDERKNLLTAMVDELKNDKTELKEKADHFEKAEQTQRDISAQYKALVEDIKQKTAEDFIAEAKKALEQEPKEEEASPRFTLSPLTKKFLFIIGIIGFIVFAIWILLTLLGITPIGATPEPSLLPSIF